MQISVFGRTDKRACIYTLMKILQHLGDVAVVTDDRHFTRLTEDGEKTGTYQNISIFVTDTTGDEVWEHIGYDSSDFDHVILDNMYSDDTALYLYVRGAGDEALDEDLFDCFDDMKVIQMGGGKNCVPYTKELMEGLEYVEYYRKLHPLPSPAMTQIVAGHLSPHLNMPVKNIVKVANKK